MDRVDLIAWAGYQEILDDGLAEWEDVGVGWQNGENEVPINRSIGLQPCSHAWYKRERWVRDGDMLGEDI